MVMSFMWCSMLFVSVVCAVITGSGQALAISIPQGGTEGIRLAFTMAGSICLWSGLGRLLSAAGVMDILSRLLTPVLRRIFPVSVSNPELSLDLSGNICANLLGLGNAATPMGIRAVRGMSAFTPPGVAGDEMCRFIVLNTASIQLIPANVTAIRVALGCSTPFDILPAVWVTSFCSAGLGLVSAWILGKVWSHE